MTRRRTLRLGSRARLIWASLGLFVSSLAGAAGGPPLPVLKYVGVIPVSWEETLDDTPEQKLAVTQSFSQAVRSARRFQVLSDEVVKELWGSEEGRKDLSSNYELSAFAHLGVHRRGDAAAFEMRLMSPRLKNYLVESETVALSWLRRADEAQLKDRLESLVYRVFNRLPVDVSVMSVQGPYVTVSGGEEQGLRVGDELTFQRVTIASQHPANGSWVSFDTSRLGRAKIIEVKRAASVAEMVEQSYDGAIKIGDGAKVPAIANRRRFAPAPGGAEAFSSVASGSPLVAPVPTQGSAVKSAEKPAPSPNPAEASPPVAPSSRPPQGMEDKTSRESLVAAPTEPAPAPSPEPEAETSVAEVAEGEPTPELATSLLAALKQHFSDVSLGFGPRLWSASGSASAGSVLPAYIFNQADLRFRQSLTPLLRADYRGNFGFGPTGKGSFYNFGLRGDVYARWDFKDALKPIRYLDAGGVVQYQSLGVTGEKFGGYDIISLGALAAVAGKTNLGATVLDWRTRFLFVPQAMGDVGVRGGKRNVTGVFAFELGAEVLVEARPGAWEWGAQGAFGSTDYSLDTKYLTFTDFSIGALARLRL